MKKFTILLLTLAFALPGLAKPNKLSKAEKDFIINYLTESQERLIEVANSVDDDLWKYKSSDDSWTVESCFEHILFAEARLTEKILDKMLAAEPNNETNLAYYDAMVIAKVADRGKKVKTPKPFEPVGRWASKQDMIDELKRSRAFLIDFVKSTKKDLRAYTANSPVGERDAYQHLIIIAGHGLRHTMQMEEIIEQHNELAVN